MHVLSILSFPLDEITLKKYCHYPSMYRSLNLTSYSNSNISQLLKWTYESVSEVY